MSKSHRIGVLGASGSVGRHIVKLAIERGYEVVCQTRSAEKLVEFADQVRVHEFNPTDKTKLAEFLNGVNVVVFALGADIFGAKNLFSKVTEALIDEMAKHGVRRLIVITGVGAGETRGHGGFLYDWIFYPLITRHLYKDKDKQEAMIESSGLEWIIVRPAVFSDRKFKEPIEILTEIKPNTVLRRISREEVAAFVVDQFESDRYLGKKPFIGHP